MSFEVSTFYWDQCTDVTGRDRLVILALADYCNESGWCFPSVPELARRCRLSDRGVQKILARLAGGGHIAVEANGGMRKTSGSPTHRYHLLAYQRSTGRGQGEPMRAPLDSAKGEQITAKGEQSAAKGEPASSPEPIIHSDPTTNAAPSRATGPPPAARKPSAAAPAAAGDYQKVVKAYHDEIGTLTPIVEEEIKAELARSSPDWVLRAIGVAAMRNHRRWAYVAGILRRWHAEGFDGGLDNRAARTPPTAKAGGTTASRPPGKSTGYGRQPAPALRAKGQSIEDYADDPEYYAQLKALYAGGPAAEIAAD